METERTSAEPMQMTGNIPPPPPPPPPPLQPSATLQHNTTPARPLEDDVETLIVNKPAFTANMSEIDKLQILADRRAFGDILLMTKTLLQNNTHWATLFQQWKDTQQNQQYNSLALDSQQADLQTILQYYGHALVSLKQWDELKQQVETWPSPNTEAYSLSLRIAVTRWKQYLPHGKESSVKDELTLLRSQHPVRIDLALVDLFLSRKSWRPAVERLETIIQHVDQVSQDAAKYLFSDGNDNHTNNDAVVFLRLVYTTDLYSRQGRILLQVGAIQQALVIFQKAQQCWQNDDVAPEHKSHDWYIQAQMQLLLNMGLYELASGNQEKASTLFAQTATLFTQANRQHPAKKVSNNDTLSWIPTSIVTTHCEAVTNLSVCALYSCQLSRAIQLLEDLVRSNPTNYLTERVALNLCTMYELQGDGATSTRKKRALQRIAKRFMLHDVGTECFRFH